MSDNEILQRTAALIESEIRDPEVIREFAAFDAKKEMAKRYYRGDAPVTTESILTI